MLKKNFSRSPTFDLENIKLHSSSYPHNFQNENEQITTRNGTELHSPTFGDGPQLSPILHLSSSNSPTLQPPRLSSRGRRSLTSVSSFEYLRWRRRRRVVAKKTLNWEFLANTIEVNPGPLVDPIPMRSIWTNNAAFLLIHLDVIVHFICSLIQPSISKYCAPLPNPSVPGAHSSTSSS